MTTAAGLFLFFVLPGSAPAFAQDAETAARIQSWGASLPIDPRVSAELARFEKSDEVPDTSYAVALATAVRELVLSDAIERIEALEAGTIEPFVEVTFLDPGFASDGEEPDRKVERELEDGFIKTEVLAVFAGLEATPDEAMRELTSAVFRQSVSSRIARIWNEDDLNCVETRGVGPLLSPMNSCAALTELRAPGLAIHHSQTVANDDDSDYQRVFFKESLKTIVAIPEGLAFHYVNYSRTAKIGGLKRLVGGGKIGSSQEKMIRELGSVLGAESVEPD